MEDSRVRNFAFVMYPESAPENWQHFLEDLAIPCLISPLHDKDIIPETGEQKKPHWHCCLAFSGKKSPAQVVQLLAPLGVKHVDQVNDLRGYARYMCHLDFFDRPDKRLYSPSDVIQFNGADYDDLIHSVSDTKAYCSEMISFIEDHNVQTFHAFVLYCKLNEPEWYDVVLNQKTMFFKFYLSSKYSENHPESEKK